MAGLHLCGLVLNFLGPPLGPHARPFLQRAGCAVKPSRRSCQFHPEAAGCGAEGRTGKVRAGAGTFRFLVPFRLCGLEPWAGPHKH